MRSADLEAEAEANFRRLTTKDVRNLVDAGIDPMLVLTGMIGAGRVRHEAGLYDLDPLGKLAYLSPIRIQTSWNPESSNPRGFAMAGGILDIVAWAPNAREFALRTGAATWAGLIGPQYLDRDPIRVHRTILGWLRSDLAGLVLLTDDPVEARHLLGGAVGIIAEDDAHAAELRKLLSRPVRSLPRITAQKAGRHAT